MGHPEILFTSWAKEVVNRRSLLLPTAIVMTTASIKGKVIATSPTSRSLTSHSPTSPTCHVSSDRMHSHDILIAHFTSGMPPAGR